MTHCWLMVKMLFATQYSTRPDGKKAIITPKISGMKVIICGAGQVGWQIARHLSGERNDVTVVDLDPDLIRRATETLDVNGIVGHASYPDILERAGARDADMIIAATHSDEVNMVTCQVAHSVISISRKVARLR